MSRNYTRMSVVIWNAFLNMQSFTDNDEISLDEVSEIMRVNQNCLIFLTKCFYVILESNMIANLHNKQTFC